MTGRLGLVRFSETILQSQERDFVHPITGAGHSDTKAVLRWRRRSSRDFVKHLRAVHRDHVQQIQPIADRADDATGLGYIHESPLSVMEMDLRRRGSLMKRTSSGSLMNRYAMSNAIVMIGVASRSASTGRANAESRAVRADTLSCVHPTQIGVAMLVRMRFRHCRPVSMMPCPVRTSITMSTPAAEDDLPAASTISLRNARWTARKDRTVLPPPATRRRRTSHASPVASLVDEPVVGVREKERRIAKNARRVRPMRRGESPGQMMKKGRNRAERFAVRRM